ncbi:hypothetical protein BBJ28_00026928, partial [Nothophytophthora sp. Chile5]
SDEPWLAMATLYDDGSSTESEYYFDPVEETAEAARDALEVKQEPVAAGGREPEAEDQWTPLALNCRNAELPPGSEWSHGVATSHCDIDESTGSGLEQRLAVENALAMAKRTRDELNGGSRQQQEEELTADTLESNEQDATHEAAAPNAKEEAVEAKGSAPVAKAAEKEVPGVPKAEEMKASKPRPRIVSLKSRPPPASMAVASGLRRPLTKVLGAPRELEEGLSVPRNSEQKTVASLNVHHSHASIDRSGDASKEKDLPSRRHENWRDTTGERKERCDGAHRSDERDSGGAPRLRELRSLSARRSAAPISSRERTPDVKSDVNARSPVRPHVRMRVGASPARSGTGTGQEKINRNEARAGKKMSTLKHAKPSHVLLDAFARRVRKLKLQEADVDEQFAVRSLNPSDKWFLEKRMRGMATEKAQLEAQNCERFETLYKAMAISEAEVQQYRQDRAFAWRVVCFKRKQTFLQDQR